MIPANLTSKIATRRCTLFAGSGLTAKTGGSTWPELIHYLKKELNYSSPLKDDFQIMGDMCQKYGQKKIYETVQDKLKGAYIQETLKPFIGLPWFTVFTTNYDLALEKALNEVQLFNIRTIYTGKEFALTGMQSEMLCVKLMGSLDVQYGNPGAMVLTSGDLSSAQEERSRIFDILQSHAANLTFLFVGYSFNDRIFIEVLERLQKDMGNPPNTYYAVLRTAPNAEKDYLFKQLNIEVILSDLEAFTTELTEQVALQAPGDLTRIRIPIGSEVIPLKTTKATNFLSFYNLVLFEDMESQIDASQFYKGNPDYLKPFELKWHFPRKEINTIVENIVKGKTGGAQHCIVTVEGNPGAGRTFILSAAMQELIRKHNSLAIRIPSYSLKPIPEIEELNEFTEEVEKAAKECGVRGPERIIFVSKYPLDNTDISHFKTLCTDSKIPIHLLYEDFKSPRGKQEELNINTYTIDADVDLTAKEKGELAKYIVETTQKHKLPEIDIGETEKIIKEEEKFLPIMYRALDPARRSINTIVQEQFKAINEQEIQNCIALCALGSGVELDFPVAVLRKALGKMLGKMLTYPEIFDIILNKSKAFINLTYDPRTNPLVSIYHTVIARYISEILGRKRMDECLLSIAQTVDLRSRIEADFAGQLVIQKGVNYENGASRPFTVDGLEAAMKELKKKTACKANNPSFSKVDCQKGNQ